MPEYYPKQPIPKPLEFREYPMVDAGLFGGTFNPLHNGHLDIVTHVKETCGLDRVYIYPSATPPHKPTGELAPALDRMAMVEKSLGDLPGLFASDIELKRQGPSYTIDTIKAFRRDLKDGVRLHLLMGSDAFFDISTWKEKDRIFAAVSTIVMLRGEPTTSWSMASFIDEHISKGYTLKQDYWFVHDRLRPIRICQVPRIDISSTMIRQRISLGKSIAGLVPEPVEAIIKTKDLYT